MILSSEHDCAHIRFWYIKLRLIYERMRKDFKRGIEARSSGTFSKPFKIDYRKS